jgi:hypothetical protein
MFSTELPLTTGADPSAARALVMIIDPEQDADPPKMLIRRFFGLHHIFDKTDTHRQAELVRLLLTIIP